MKSFGFLILLGTFISCDPYGFGFKKNPAYVLDEALKAIINRDQTSFLEVTGKEIYCMYGNEQGLNYLNSSIKINQESIKMVPTVLESRYNPAPTYVGYWSYFHERYQVDVLDKISSELLMKVIVDCEYGTEGAKDSKFFNLKPKKYKKKECRAVKAIPQTFEALPMTEKCSYLKVTL